MKRIDLKKLADVQVIVDDSKYISLEKLIGKKIKEVIGYVSMEFGDPTFKLSRIVFEDDTDVFVSGEHDIAYLEEVGDSHRGLDHRQLKALYDEEENAE